MSPLPTLGGFDPADPIVQRLPDSVQVYVVGGAVRDALLGLSSSDRDWVVVGATAQVMEDAGFRPVGADFPVFLHPQTQEEYALARTERKSGVGYKGFTLFADPSVSLEDDLRRRDFTINAMAMRADGTVIDPYGGWADLQAKVFRHVSPAFAEDPLRVLRLARFLARFHAFEVAPPTQALCRSLVASGELAHLTAERVFQELNRGMAQAHPSRMCEFLSSVGAWASLAPVSPGALAATEAAVLNRLDHWPAPDLRWAWAVGASLGQEAELAALAKAWVFPADLTDLCRVALQVQQVSESAASQTAADWVAVLARLDVLRKPQRLLRALELWPAPVAGSAIHFVHEAAIRHERGEYRDALRQHLTTCGAAGATVASAVEAFRLNWVQSLLAELHTASAPDR